jgi:aminoglycoside phosphotransferase (APT) family kinase protein
LLTTDTAAPSASELALGPSAAAAITASVRRMGLASADEAVQLSALTGGVSSEIVRVQVGPRVFCSKRALPQLRVAAEWLAPVGRNAAEADWMAFAAKVVPQAVPALLGRDPEAGAFAMAYLEPADYPVWKGQLLAGVVEPATAEQVGRTLVALHAASARTRGLAERFAHQDNFFQLRLDPYFVSAARAHPALAATLHRLVDDTARTQRALVHGDVSPKNILVGRQGPVLLDAECATWGDPAFDLAFCLNHLLLKGWLLPAQRPGLLRSIEGLRASYLAGVDWEDAAQLELRVARLLPALLLARVDGKSPVEYLSTPAQRAPVRDFAVHGLQRPYPSIRPLALAWSEQRA